MAVNEPNNPCLHWTTRGGADRSFDSHHQKNEHQKKYLPHTILRQEPLRRDRHRRLNPYPSESNTHQLVASLSRLVCRRRSLPIVIAMQCNHISHAYFRLTGPQKRYTPLSAQLQHPMPTCSFAWVTTLSFKSRSRWPSWPCC